MHENQRLQGITTEFKTAYGGNHKPAGSPSYQAMLVVYTVMPVVGMGALGCRLMSVDEESKGSPEAHSMAAEMLQAGLSRQSWWGQRNEQLREARSRLATHMQGGQNATCMGSAAHLTDKEELGVGTVVRILTVAKGSCIGLVPRMTRFRSSESYSE